jgi:hypothetical protein
MSFKKTFIPLAMVALELASCTKTLDTLKQESKPTKPELQNLQAYRQEAQKMARENCVSEFMDGNSVDPKTVDYTITLNGTKLDNSGERFMHIGCTFPVEIAGARTLSITSVPITKQTRYPNLVELNKMITKPNILIQFKSNNGSEPQIVVGKTK